ncbi:MAG: replicative DNA helicase [Sideroxydans sp.]|nr:replicative DNA helicase [Sideroxydans sp.]
MNAPVEFTIPHSVEAEQSVLGGLLIDNGAIDRMGELLEPAFYTQANRLIYRAIIKQASAGKAWDVITIAEMLKNFGKLEQVGGLPYIGSLAHNVPSSANIKRYAEIVREHAMRREIISAAAELTELVQHKGDVAVAMDKAQSRLMAITQTAKTDEPKSITEIISEHLNVVERRLEGEATKAITTGLDGLDEILNGGWHRGQVIVLAARPSMGKTALSMHHALQGAVEGFGVLYLSMEMVASELADRAIASMGRVNLGNLLTAKMSSDEWGGVTNATVKMQDIPLHVLDRSGLNFFQVATYARRHKRKHGMDLLVVDYLQLMAGADGEKRHAQIEEITRNLKSLAKELDVAIILLSQLSRKTEESRRPKLSHLRDSGSIEQDADVVLFIHREEVDNPETEWKNYADIHVAKNRQGALGRVGVSYIGHQVRFDNFSGALPDWDAKQTSQHRGFK